MNRIITLLICFSAFGQASAQVVAADSVMQHVKGNRLSVGGYGEACYSRNFYSDHVSRYSQPEEHSSDPSHGKFDIPHAVIYLGYDFGKGWSFGTEVEFEHGGNGLAYEKEDEEGGEWEQEVEKGGEVELEQFWIQKTFSRAANLRAGHIVVPVGLNNAYHEPLNFFTVYRPEGEDVILPSTWHETGVSLFGAVGHDWSRVNYEAYVTAGLNANGFDRNTWVAGGKQGMFEVDNFTSPAYVARLNYRGIPGLRLGASFYYLHNAASNSDKPHTYSFNVPVRIWSVDAQYQHRYFIARGNLMGGYVGNSDQLSAKNNRLSSSSPYSRLAPVAKRAVSYGAEAGLRLRNMAVTNKMPDLIPFVRYEYYNAQQEVVVSSYNLKAADPRLKTSMWVAGLNYRPLPYLVVKADYTKRRIGDGSYKNENEFALGVAFTGWFLSDNKFKRLRK